MRHWDVCRLVVSEAGRFRRDSLNHYGSGKLYWHYSLRVPDDHLHGPLRSARTALRRLGVLRHLDLRADLRKACAIQNSFVVAIGLYGPIILWGLPHSIDAAGMVYGGMARTAILCRLQCGKCTSVSRYRNTSPQPVPEASEACDCPDPCAAARSISIRTTCGENAT